MGANTPSPWTEEKVSELKRLREEGYSASKMAELLCFPSRNAIIGKLHRLGLCAPKREARQPIHRKPHPGVRRYRKSHPSWIRPVREVIGPALAPLNVGLLDLELNNCRWVLEERGDNGLALFCGHEVKPGRSFCTPHDHVVTR